jgi:hypothetical protein
MYNILNSDERYERGFIKGYRIGRISATRKIFINVIKRMGEPSKKIIQKINSEADLIFLDLMIEYALKKNKNLNDVELAYDKLIRSEKEFADEKYCTYEKSGSPEKEQ